MKKLSTLIKIAAGHNDWFSKFTHVGHNVGGVVEPFLRHGSKMGKGFQGIGFADSFNQVRGKNYLGAVNSALGSSNPLFGAVTTGNSLGKDVYNGFLKGKLPGSSPSITGKAFGHAPKILGKGSTMFEQFKNSSTQAVKPVLSKMQIKSPTQTFVGPSIKGLNLTRGTNSQWNSKSNLGSTISQKY